jgi:hypothetical protein
MKNIFLLVVAIALAGCQNSTSQAPASSAPNPHAGHNMGGNSSSHNAAATPKLNINSSKEFKAGESAELELSITGAGVERVKNFVMNHDAKVHLILIRDGLDQFFHLHPVIDSETGMMKVNHTFPVAGLYHVFADHQQPGGTMTTAVTTLRVAGDAAAAKPLAVTVPGTIEADGLKANVTVTKDESGTEKVVRFELTDAAGKAVDDLEPYMGARGHLVVVSADASRYVHAHPLESTTAKNVVAFAAHFPQPGMHKGWGQFKRAGTVRIVPFVVNVE